MTLLEFFATRIEFFAVRIEFFAMRIEFFAVRVTIYVIRFEFFAARLEFLASRREFLNDAVGFAATPTRLVGMLTRSPERQFNLKGSSLPDGALRIDCAAVHIDNLPHD